MADVKKKTISKTGGVKTPAKNVGKGTGKAVKKTKAAGKAGGKAVKPASAAGKAVGKTVGKTTGKAAAGKPVGKAAGKTASKAVGKVAGKTVGKATGKTAGKTTEKAAGKVVGKTVGKAAGKVVGKTVNKVAGKPAVIKPAALRTSFFKPKVISAGKTKKTMPIKTVAAKPEQIIITQEFIEKMELSLVELKANIVENLISNSNDFKEIVEGMDAKDFVDIASDDIDRKIIEAIGYQELKRLKLIESAITRIKQGKYGHCIKCDRHIPPDRLEAIPYALMCFGCKLEEERRNR